MSIPLLYETQNELRRLFIAGCELAADDFRLKKLLPQLQKAGENVPVFAKAAETLGHVLDPGEEGRSEKMLELANIVNAVLYTQGQTSIEGDLEDIHPAGLCAATDVPFRCLQPVLDALTGQGSGRLEIIRDAFADGMFRDLRLVYPLISALDDSYAEIADMASGILEGYGKPLVSILRKTLVIDGGKGHARRIELISKLKCGLEKELYLEVIVKGDSEAKVAAIRALKGIPDCEDLLLELSHDRKKDNREASLIALAHLGTEAAVRRIFDVFSSKEKALAVYPMKSCKAKKITLQLVEEGYKLLESILKSEKGFSLFSKKAEPPTQEELGNFAVILECMEGKKDDEILAFLERCLLHTKHLQQFKLNNTRLGRQENLAEMAAGNIIAVGSKESLNLMESARGKYDDTLIAYSFEAAIRSRDAAYVFDSYARYLKGGRRSEEGRRILEVMDQYIDFEERFRLAGIFMGIRQNNQMYETCKVQFDWDPRWLKVLADIDETGLVCRLASKQASWCADYLVRKLAIVPEQDTSALKDIIRGLLQAGYTDMMSIVKTATERCLKKSGYYSGYIFNDFAQVLRFLPKECAKGLEELALKQDNSSAGKLFEVAQYLKIRSELV